MTHRETAGSGHAAGTETSSEIGVVLVDDQQLVRAGFAMVIEATDGMTVVGQAADGVEALELLAATPADVVLMDIRMPRLDGLETTRRLLADAGPAAGQVAGEPTGAQAPRVIVLTTFDLDEYAFAALQSGASGFLLKDAGPDELVAAIRAVHSGDAVVAPSTTRRLIDTFVQQSPAATPAAGSTSTPGVVDPGVVDPEGRLAPLTEREREVLEAVARGLSNQEIAATFFLAEATVKTHIGAILRKLDLRDRVQMVVLGYETGLVRPGAEE